MNADTSWEGNHRYIRWFASKALQRAMAAGIRGIQLDDFVQEATIAWLIACKHFDPTRGVPFIPYLKLGMQRHINRWLSDELGEAAMTPKSLDVTVGENGTTELGDLIADTSAISADELVIRKDVRARVLGLLSPRARRYLELLESPPPELLEEMNAILAKARLGRAMGLTRFEPVRVSSDLIFKLMGAPNHERQRIHREIEAAIQKVSG